MKEKGLSKIKEALLNFDEKDVKLSVTECVESGIDPIMISNIMNNTIKEIGDMFANYEIFLPELMIAAEAMKAGMAVLMPSLLEKKIDVPSLGVVVIGTVKGDLHDIGKNMVATMLQAEGFTVMDLGVDASNKMFVEAVQRYNADILAASTLMTTTRVQAKQLIEYVKALGLRDKCKIMVGGAAISAEYSKEIGADGYAETCVDAVELAKSFVKRG